MNVGAEWAIFLKELTPRPDGCQLKVEELHLLQQMAVWNLCWSLRHFVWLIYRQKRLVGCGYTLLSTAVFFQPKPRVGCRVKNTSAPVHSERCCEEHRSAIISTSMSCPYVPIGPRPMPCSDDTKDLIIHCFICCHPQTKQHLISVSV